MGELVVVRLGTGLKEKSNGRRPGRSGTMFFGSILISEEDEMMPAETRMRWVALETPSLISDSVVGGHFGDMAAAEGMHAELINFLSTFAGGSIVGVPEGEEEFELEFDYEEIVGSAVAGTASRGGYDGVGSLWLEHSIKTELEIIRGECVEHVSSALACSLFDSITCLFGGAVVEDVV